MSDEWPDDDPKFTGPKCRLDNIGGAASGDFTKPQRTARRYYAVCEIVQKMLTANTIEGMGRIKVVDDYEDEDKAEMMARKHAAKIIDELDMGTVRTVTVMPIWRVK